MLSHDDINAMRATVRDSLPDSGTIQRVTLTDDGMGGGSAAWAAIGTAACRVSPYQQRSAFEGTVGERSAAVASWLVTFPNGTAIAPADRINTGGRTLEVINMRAPRSWELSRQVECREAS